MKLNRILTVLAVVLLVGLPLFAQTTSSLTGTVSLGGNPLPGATVTISSPNLQGVRTAVTDTNGNYNFGGIPPGDYTVKFEMESMQTATRSVRLGLSTTAKADAELKLSTMAEAITVTASAPAVLETTEIQTNISAKLIEDLPIGRTLLATVNLAPGVTTNGVGGATVISGAFAFDSTFYVDGAVVNEVLRGQPQNLFIEDALQETTIQTGAISAEYGRFTGGVVTAISKSGGNEFSGSIRDNVNNAKWTAQGFLKEARPANKIFNTYEATLGGRIIRDRLWFFAAGRDYTLDTQAFLRTTKITDTPIPFTRGDKERRLEGKLTGQLTPRHTLVGTIFDVKRDQTNVGTPLEFSALDTDRSLPQRFYTGNYNGVITNNFLVEATYAKQLFKFVNSGADAPAPPERGTNVTTQGGLGASGYPTFCGGCAPPETRNNSNAKVKGSYFLSTKASGTHNITGGYENYHDYLKADNNQSASDFTLLLYTTSFFDGGAVPAPTRAPNGDLLQSLHGNGLIVWWPVLQHSQGNDFNTQSLFANDKWDLNSRLNLNLGVRYDKNHGKNQAGVVVAKDSAVSPRLGLTYDVFGNGRLRLNGSYSQYVSKVANGNVGDATSGAGVGSYLYWGYNGPDVTNVTTNVLLDTVFGWFRSVGFTNNRDFLFGGQTSGITSQIKGTLKSPGVHEFTVGAGTQIGQNGFVRADYQDRKWNNFYTQNVSLANGKIFDPLAGADLDIGLVGNSDDFTRTYKAVLVQGSYRLFNRVNLGANYTYSKLRGNIEGETAGSGPITSGSSGNYPEYTGFANNNPMGFLNEDQRHKARAWASIDIPTFLGLFNVSALQRYDSGTPYSVAVGNLNPQNRAACRLCPVNPGYTTPPNAINYYFSQRGEFRLSDISSTDLALNYSLPLGRASLFAQGELINAFNRQTKTGINTSVSIIRSFDPFHGSAVECPQGQTAAQCVALFPAPKNPDGSARPTGELGIYQKGVNFGKALTPTTGSSLLPGGANGSYQLPRTYRVSLGVRF